MSYFEFHCHTAPFSKDAGALPERIIRRCRERGVHGIAITDHDTIEGARRFQALAPDWLQVIVGEEINTEAGEIIGIFLKDQVAPGNPVRTTLEEIKRQGGLAIVPHPFDRCRKKVLDPRELERNLDLIDALELFNARNLFAADNRAAARFAREHQKKVICASDAHFIGEYGRTLMSGIDPTTPERFLQTLNHHHFVRKSSSLAFHLLSAYQKILSRLTG